MRKRINATADGAFDNAEWFRDLDRIYGGTNGIAEKFGIEPSAVSYWRKKRVPDLQQLQLMIMHPNTFTPDRLARSALMPSVNDSIPAFVLASLGRADVATAVSSLVSKAA